MDFPTKIIVSFRLLTIFTISSILDIWMGSECAPKCPNQKTTMVGSLFWIFLWHCCFDEHQGRLHCCKQFIIHFLINTSTLLVPRNTAVINCFEIIFHFGNNTHISGTLNNENVVFVFVFWVFSYFADVWSEGDSNFIFHSSNKIINNLNNLLKS